MSAPDFKRIRLRFLVLPLLAIACAILCTVHTKSVGSVHEHRLIDYKGLSITSDNISVDPRSMARILDVHTAEDGTPVVTIEGLEPGKGFLLVTLPDQGGARQLRVDPGPVVVVDGANFTGWEYFAASVALCFAVAGILCAWALQTLRRHSWYGYEMASYAGGALFCLAQAAVFGSLLLSGREATFTDFAEAVTNLADTFVNIMLWPMAAMALFVSASNVALLRREGRSPRNALGIAASIALALACVALHGLDLAYLASTSEIGFLFWTLFDSVIAIGVCYAMALLAGTCACAYGAAKHLPSHPRSHLIICGCGLRADGTPTPLLAGRVDAALAFARNQEEAGMPAPTFVPSGGQGADEACSEAESMRGYLLSKGVDDSQIVPEAKSTNTRENFAYSAKLIAADGGTADQVAFATTNYHVFRSYVYAHDAGLNAEGIAAPTKLYFWPNAFLREFVGLLASRWLTTLLTYLGVAAIYLVAEYALLLSLG